MERGPAGDLERRGTTMPKIQITTTDAGWGRRGEVLNVSKDRAERWCARGIAKPYAPESEKAPEQDAQEEKSEKQKKK